MLNDSSQVTYNYKLVHLLFIILTHDAEDTTDMANKKKTHESRINSAALKWKAISPALKSMGYSRSAQKAEGGAASGLSSSKTSLNQLKINTGATKKIRKVSDKPPTAKQIETRTKWSNRTKEASKKWNEAKAAGSTGGKNWNEFLKQYSVKD